MCEPERTRRRFLVDAGLSGLAALGVVSCARPSGVSVVTSESSVPSAATHPTSESGADTVDLVIQPRSAWGADLSPTGPIAPDEVRFVLVHHTAGSNDVTDVAAEIRGVYRFHTGPAKGWPDVAYHFFVGPDGSVWEGRQGSLEGAYEASATGGNQGWAQLVCLIGNHVSTPPPPAAQDSVVRLLAWLTQRYGLDPLGTTTYESRGSNRHPAGAIVETSVIAGHRDASFTMCPGDAAYGLLPEWRRRVAGLVATPST